MTDPAAAAAHPLDPDSLWRGTAPRSAPSPDGAFLCLQAGAATASP